MTTTDTTRLLSPLPSKSDGRAMRPASFDAYVGQEKLIERLRIAVGAAKVRQEPLAHVLLHGPPGLGKTSLALVIAHELGHTCHITSGPSITKGDDLVGVLLKLMRGDVLFIDEIHRLPAIVEETLYPAMEDFHVDMILGSGMDTRTITIPLPSFTLVGATTRIGQITAPLRSRFDLALNVEFYSVEALGEIITRNLPKLGIVAETEAITELAKRSRGTPRIANRLLRRAADHALVMGDGTLTVKGVQDSMRIEGVDPMGLDEQDRKFLRTIVEIYDGGPVGIEAVAATMGEEVETIVDVVEPYLLQAGLVLRTKQGRTVTDAALQIVKEH